MPIENPGAVGIYLGLYRESFTFFVAKYPCGLLRTECEIVSLPSFDSAPTFHVVNCSFLCLRFVRFYFQWCRLFAIGHKLLRKSARE